jgi:hypothetical protein
VSGTWGDLARRALTKRGLLYFGDVLDDIKVRLSRADTRTGTILAAACATRLMRAHSSRPVAEQEPFTLQWAPVVELVWDALDTDRPEPIVSRVRQTLEGFYASPYDHSDGRDGPPDADEDAAAAAIYTAESLCAVRPDAAFYAASVLIDWAFSEAENPPVAIGTAQTSDSREFIEDAACPVVQRELHRLIDALATLEREGTGHGVRQRVRDSFERAG